MPQGCFIGIDQGSSSTKALVITAKGEVAFETRRSLPPPFREGLRIEQDPLEILTTVQDVVKESAQAAKASGLEILGIGLSCQRSSCLIWNEATGEPLSPLLSWRDTRGADLVESLAKSENIIFKTTGLPLTPYYSASKLRWLKDNLPASRQDTTIFGTLSSFLVQRLTVEKKAAIDHTNAARTQLMNIRTIDWDPELLKLFGLEGIRLPMIQPTAHQFGMVQTPANAAPLLACIGDQQSAMLGLGVMEKGDGGINYGTGGFLMVNTGAGLVPAKGLMASVHYSTEKERYYLLEGSVNAVGESLEWLRVRLGLFKEYGEVDDLCWKASSDVVVFTGLNGTGAPHWESAISTSVHGLTIDSTPADIVRGTVEGIAFFMKDIAEEIRSAGIEPASFTLSGGLSSLSYLVQVQCDLLQKNAVVSTVQEVSALGAALLAGLKQGQWTAGEVKTMVSRGDVVNGEANPGAERRYRRWRELHRMTRELDRM
jgi:glycerol kinase